ncbi:MAG: AAC(3) family N-acetyltransferase [Cyclobacteriaceae bacterium]
MSTNNEYQELRQSLEILGVQSGDIILLKGDLSEVGLVGGSPKESRDLIFKVLWDAIGGEEQGTIITSAFTQAFFKWNLTDFVFDQTSPSKSGGAITKYFLQHPRSVRSEHPTNSFIALGKFASELLEGHDETSRPYSPVGKVIERNGRVLSFGTVADPPDFMTGHYAQQEAGLTTRTVLKFLTGVKYRKNDEIKVYEVKEAGGCTRGHHIVYSEYVRLRKLRTVFFGNAYSISMLAKDAFEIAYAMHKKNPRAFICKDSHCFSCRGTWFWNMRAWPMYYMRNSWRILNKMVRPDV